MTNLAIVRNLFPSQFAALVLASAIGIPAWAQQSQPAGDAQSAPPSATQQQTYPEAAPYVPPAKEGFWGHVNPFARKVWVRKQTDPINNRLSELDQVNAKNAADIKDTDQRAQAGIFKAQSAADAANQTATAATAQAQNAKWHCPECKRPRGSVEFHGQRSRQVSPGDRHRYRVPWQETRFCPRMPRSCSTTWPLGVTGQNGYILEMEAHSPHAGSVGIQSSQRLAESVERYLVTEHQIPVYRMHFVALGNAEVASAGNEDRPQSRRGSAMYTFG